MLLMPSIGSGLPQTLEARLLSVPVGEHGVGVTAGMNRSMRARTP